MPIAKTHARRMLLVLGLLAGLAWAALCWQRIGSPSAWLASARAWAHGVHQQLRTSGVRVNGAVQHAAQTNRALAGDDAISAAISDAYAASQSDDLRGLQVDTRNAMVTLSGTVPSADLRDRAIALALKAPGVHGVFCLVSVVPAPLG